MTTVSTSRSRLITWIMLVSGLLPCSMFYATIAPDAAFQVGVSVAVDAIMVALFAAYLISTRPKTGPAA